MDGEVGRSEAATEAGLAGIRADLAAAPALPPPPAWLTQTAAHWLVQIAEPLGPGLVLGPPRGASADADWRLVPRGAALGQWRPVPAGIVAALTQVGCLEASGHLTEAGRALVPVADRLLRLLADKMPPTRKRKGKGKAGDGAAGDGAGDGPGETPRETPRGTPRETPPGPPREEDIPPPDDDGPERAGPGDGGDGEGGGPWRRAGLPPDCPVVPLGSSREWFYYLDARRQFRELKDEKHNKANLLGLFTPHHSWLYGRFPRQNADGHVTGWKAETVAERLMAACCDRGLWTPRDRVRGTGAWATEDGRLVLHLGDRVLVPDAETGERLELAPGVVGDVVYPAADRIFGPADGMGEAACGVAPGLQLLELLRRWNWRRGELDARLMLGWMVAALAGGALRWRPAVWLTGDKGTGKSTLQDEVLEHVMGRWLLRAADATQASLYQTAGHASLAVALDELEPNPDRPQKTQAVVELMRIAASGGKLRRGGKEGEATEYSIRSAFLFSSILMPPLTSQDRSRLAVLELDPLTPGPPLKVDPARLRGIGRALLRRLLDGWDRLPRIVEGYRAELSARGHSARGVDVFGTLLACAWLVLRDDVPEAEGDPLAQEDAAELAAETLAAASGDRPDHEQCLNHLLTSVADVFRGGTRRTIGNLVHEAAWSSDPMQRSEANIALGLYGLTVRAEKVPDPRSGEQVPRPHLAVANSHTNLAGLFEGTVWAQGQSGQPGVWVQSLRRTEGARAADKPVWIDKKAQRVTLLPLDTVLPENGPPDQPGLWAGGGT